MEKLKSIYQQSVMNEDAMLEKIKKSAPKNRVSIFSSKPIWFKVGLAVSLVLFLVFAQDIFLPRKNTVTIGHVTANSKLAYAMVGVDINPSFELYMDMDDIVIDVRTFNDESQTINLEGLIGLPINQAIDQLIVMVKDAGFLNVLSPDKDTIVISTVSFGADETRLITELKLALLASRAIDRSVRTYVIEGDEDDYEASERQNVSLGIYLLNGMIQNNGKLISVKEFVSNPNNLEVLEEMAEHTSDSERASVIRALIDELKLMGVDVSAYESRLDQDNEDLEDLIEDVKDAFDPEDDREDDSDDTYEDDSNSGSSEGSWNDSEESDDHESEVEEEDD